MGQQIEQLVLDRQTQIELAAAILERTPADPTKAQQQFELLRRKGHSVLGAAFLVTTGQDWSKAERRFNRLSSTFAGRHSLVSAVQSGSSTADSKLERRFQEHLRIVQEVESRL